MLQDSLKFKGKRQQMIGLLQSLGIEDEKVLNAMSQVPRHAFLDSAFADYAYQNKAFSIAQGQTISHPYTVAFQTQLLDVKPGDKILEIGTGSGYQTSILLALKAKVYSIERHKSLYESSSLLLKKLGYLPNYQTFGDGYKGLPTFAPFDKIIVTAAAAKVPKQLLAQLKIGGTMVVPIGQKTQKMTTFLRLNSENFERLEFGDFQFVPMLQKKS